MNFPNHCSLSNLLVYDDDNSSSDTDCGCDLSNGKKTDDEAFQSEAKRPRLSVNNDIDNKAKDSILIQKEGRQEGRLKTESSSSLPLPGEILQLFSDCSDKREDDPSQHHGKIRSFPHVRGNWASFIYIPCLPEFPVINSINVLMQDAILHFKEDLEIFPVEDMHLSLSRTVAFRHHWIESFVSNFKKLLTEFDRMSLFLDAFTAYTNEDKTRTFVSMKVITTDALLNLVETCDKCLSDFQLEGYYKDPSFHISCVWILGDHKSWADENLVPYLNRKWRKLEEDDIELRCLSVESVEFKTGNKLYRFPLKTK